MRRAFWLNWNNNTNELISSILIVTTAFSVVLQGKSAAKQISAKEKLIGAWHLVQIETPGLDSNTNIPQPKGILIYTRDGLATFIMCDLSFSPKMLRSSPDAFRRNSGGPIATRALSQRR